MTTITLAIEYKNEKIRNKAKAAGFRWNAANKVWTKEFSSEEEKGKWASWASSNTMLMCYETSTNITTTTQNDLHYGQIGHWVNGNNGE